MQAGHRLTKCLEPWYAVGRADIVLGTWHEGEKEAVMAKHHRKQRQRGTLRPEKARTFAPEAFRRAVLRANAAASTPHPLLHERVTPHLMLQDEHREQAITLNDTPIMRVMLTLRACYPQRGDWLSALWRLQALESLLEHHDLAPWVKPVGEAWAVADPVFFVAATAPLDAKGEFLLQPFYEALARWVEEHPEPPQEAEPADD
jgi:hypothetical protein